MSARKYLKQLGVLAGLALGSAALAPSSAAAEVEAREEQQLIVVQGSGEVRARPDSLHIDVGVEARATKLDEATRKVNVTMRHVIDAVRALGIQDLTVETRILNVSPVYANRRPEETPTIVGYMASNHVSVTVRHAPVDELGARGSRVIDAALTAGANTVAGIDFFLDDPAPAEEEALARAVRDAQRDAETIARAANVTLGALHSVEEVAGMRIVPRAARLEMLASTPVEVEDIVVQSNVTARYTFR